MKAQRKQMGSARVPKDPIKAFRGMFKGLGLTQGLLQDRKEELTRDHREHSDKREDK